MNRVAHLIQASGSLRRQIWASLPFSVRLADFFSRMAVSTTEAFGKTIYGEFLAHGITDGMPDINGEPASEFDATRKPIANYLPRGYGREYGKSVFRKLMSKFHQGPQVTEQVMLDFLVDFLGGGSDALKESYSRRSAERYVMNKLEWNTKNYIRKKKETSDVYFSQGQERRHEIPVFDEETAERELMRQLPRLKSRLKAIHPDALLYIKLSLIEGYSDREIIGDVARGIESKLTDPYTRQGKPLTEASWGMTYKPKINALLQKSFKDFPISV